VKVSRLLASLAPALLALNADAASPYIGQEVREIKALSPEDVDALVTGKGMGFAKVAELNGFAGPSHVLEISDQLHLTVDQRARTEKLFASMSDKARSSGRALVDKERDLDRMFASRTATPERLRAALQEIGLLQVQVRDAHLEAHLAQVEILTPEQNDLYRKLRGYGAASEHGAHEHKH
jgi:Spy/CpxP family protein refolding chaperone